MRRTFVLASMLLAFAACGSDDTSTPTDDAVPPDAAPPDGVPPDTAPPLPDAVPSTVVEVPCAGATIASEVTAPGFNFVITQATVARNAVVRFTMPGLHNAVSGPVNAGIPAPDGNFIVNFNETKCLRFTVAGTYPFYCSPHVFTNTITVTP